MLILIEYIYYLIRWNVSVGYDHEATCCNTATVTVKGADVYMRTRKLNTSIVKTQGYRPLEEGLRASSNQCLQNSKDG